MSKKNKKPAAILQKRRAARFAAIQALFQAENGQQPIAEVIAEFKAHRLDSLLAALEEPRLVSPDVDREWFTIVAQGAVARHKQLDAAITDALRDGWTLKRCGYLMRAFLRAGTFELLERTDVPVAAVIHEYAELARLFLSRDEAGFVQAVLDKAARDLRPSAEPA